MEMITEAWDKVLHLPFVPPKTDPAGSMAEPTTWSLSLHFLGSISKGGENGTWEGRTHTAMGLCDALNY